MSQGDSLSICDQLLMTSNISLVMCDDIEPTVASERGSPTPQRFLIKVNAISMKRLVKDLPRSRKWRKRTKKLSSRILTDASEKNAIESAHLNRMKKLQKRTFPHVQKKANHIPK